MYIHVMIERFGEGSQIFEYDKSEEEVLSSVLIPYLKKETIQFDGYFIKEKDITRILIKETQKKIQEIVDWENDYNRPEGFFIFMGKENIFLGDKHCSDITKEMFFKAESQLGTNVAEKPKMSEKDNTKVFIVHGHDEAALIKTQSFIRELGLEPVVLRDTANEGLTIIEKIEKNADVGYGIVLYTACDVGAKKGQEENLNDRARQNVVFEHGYLIGRLGRSRIAALVKGEIETPNDISGVVYIAMDEHDGWKIKIIKELRNAGYNVNSETIFN
ncbi:nucleotide-binding protein [Bacillus spizizenii]|nr:nucleotide-binding protein [Bacillus subtilis]MCY8717024.1 nucleotide-binding protein [Bacillus spizizenii]